MENKDLFRMVHSGGEMYNSQAHLAEMIALLGHPPNELFKREREGRKWRWKPAIENSEGKLCESASEFYEGPFFNLEGELPGSIRCAVLCTIAKLTLGFRGIYMQASYSKSP